MNSMGKTSLSFVLRVITDGCIVLNVISMIGLFWIARLMEESLTETFGWSEPYWFILIFFAICGFFTLGILIQGHQILRTLEKNQPFDALNAKRFFRIGIFCLLLATAFLAKIFMYNTPLTVAGAFIFYLAALISFILSDVFSKASKIWEEQQLTI